MLRYAVQLTRRYDGLFTARIADMPDVTAFGRDPEEACEEVTRSLMAAVARRIRDGGRPPRSVTQGHLWVSVDAFSEPAPA